LNREDGVVLVELPGEERSDLELIEVGHHGLDLVTEFTRVRVALRRIGGFDEFQHHADVVDFLLESDDRQHGLLEAVQLRDVFLRAVAVVPECRRTHLGLHGLDLASLLIDVKETSIDARRAS
jgi:hypothetical protein